jgi:hypothetical protein
MRLGIAVIVAFVIFVIAWLMNAAVMLGLAYAATSAGVTPGFFLILNVLLAWIVAPGLGSGVALYVTVKKFKDIDPSYLLVAFVTACVVLSVLMFIFSVLAYSVKGEGFWSVVLLVFQGAAVLIGARIGKKAAQ